MSLHCHQLQTGSPAARNSGKTARRGESGQELLEFALITPLLFMLLLGIIWVARAYSIHQSITRAAREGARYAVLPSCATCGNAFPDTYAQAGACLANPTNSFDTFIAPALTAAHINPSLVTDYCQRADWLENSNPRQCGVIITFTYPVQIRIPFTSLNGTNLNLTTRVQMRMENQSATAGGTPTCP